jgi:hypothetical protein
MGLCLSSTVVARLPRLVWLLVLCPTLAACDSAPEVDSLPLAQCACPQGVCPPDRCGLQLEISAESCSGELARVEVTMGGLVDPDILTPGGPKRTCLTLARGESATFFARSDGVWQWQETLTCPPAVEGESQGPILARVLNCSAN